MQATDISSDTTVTMTVNGARQAITVDVRTSLLDLLRERLCLTCLLYTSDAADE